MEKIAFLSSITILLTASLFGQKQLYKLDSIITSETDGSQWKSVDEVVYRYDSQNRVYHYIDRTWNKNVNYWIHDRDKEYTFNSNGTVQSYLDRGTYLGGGKYDFKYDSNKNIIEKIQYKKKGSNGEWLKDSKTETKYNIEGLPSQELFLHWDASALRWVDSAKTVYAYENLTTTATDFIMTNANWQSEFKTVTVWNSDSTEKTQTEYVWNNTASDWKNFRLTEHTYGTGENKSYSLSYWHSLSSDWKLELSNEHFRHNNTLTYISYSDGEFSGKYKKKTESVFDQNNNEIEHTSFDWHFGNEQWDTTYHTINTFDSMGQKIESFTLSGNFKKGETETYAHDKWEYNETSSSLTVLKSDMLNNTRMKIVYDYHSDLSSDDLFMKYEEIGEADMLPQKVTTYVEQSQNWEEISRKQYIYSLVAESQLIAIKSNAAAIAAHPCPAHNYISFDLYDLENSYALEIKNIQGTTVLSKVVPKSAVDISSLSPGLYFYTIKNGQNEFFGKIIKE